MVSDQIEWYISHNTIDLFQRRILALAVIITVQVTCFTGRDVCNARNPGRGLALLWWDRRYTAWTECFAFPPPDQSNLTLAAPLR